MTMFKGCAITLLIVLAVVCAAPGAYGELDIHRLSAQDVKKVQTTLSQLSPLIKQRREKANLATLTFDELYAPLSNSSKTFLKNFQQIDAKKLNINIPYRGMAVGNEEFILIKGQSVNVNGKREPLPPQFLTKEVYQRYTAMMDAMQKDIGKRLYVESGYRSSAYQLYLFLASLKNHSYSIRETAKFVALPGYSEHGDPQHQAIDFISETGVNQDSPKEFENLPEYRWLLANAKTFDFVLSYPKDSKEGITFEPWHWRYNGQGKKLAIG
jgi:LAS superfamily LD-carboxypeptidase LdcB